LREIPKKVDPLLLVGQDTSDDAAVYRISEDLALIVTLDFFTPMVDDPYLFGQIAAANSLSDVYAMGGKPLLALNIACIPNCLSKEDISAIMRGGAEKVLEAGAIIAGGHTVQDEEPKYGLAVVGLVHPAKILSNATAHLSLHFEGLGSALGFTRYGNDSLVIKAENPRVRFVSADGTATNLLPNVKWENALTVFGSMIQFSSSDFINGDADRFRVLLSNSERTEQTLDVMLTQTGSVSSNRTVTLYRQADGTYASTNLLIVADHQDRILDSISTKPHNASDRIFTVALHDTLTVTYTHDGVTLTDTATVGINVKTIYVDVAVMKTNNVAVATPQRVQADMEAMQERYAQINVKVVWRQLPDFLAPPSIAADPTNWVVNDNSTWTLTQKARDIIDAAKLDASHIRVIYVPNPITYEDYSGFATAAGYAITRARFQDKLDEDYVDTCFVTVHDHTNYIPAHEVLHLLLGPGHPSQLWNLMRANFPKNADYILKDPRSWKRLTQSQEEAVHEELDWREKGNQ